MGTRFLEGTDKFSILSNETDVRFLENKIKQRDSSVVSMVERGVGRAWRWGRGGSVSKNSTSHNEFMFSAVSKNRMLRLVSL